MKTVFNRIFRYTSISFVTVCVSHNAIATSKLTTDNSFESFFLNGTPGIISGTNIKVPIPPESDISNLVATFTTVTPVQEVTVSGIPQISGVTANSFENWTLSNTYTIRSLDGTTSTDYKVILTNSAAMTNFAIEGHENLEVLYSEVEGTNITKITVKTPNALKDLQNLTPTFTLASGVRRVLVSVRQGETYFNDGCGFRGSTCNMDYDFRCGFGDNEISGSTCKRYYDFTNGVYFKVISNDENISNVYQVKIEQPNK